jgi:phenylpyruvate tautomerase PptA (4-oxalocrotonate tautomerase family)
MGGRGETVKYTTRKYKKSLSAAEKKKLIEEITKIIHEATSELTVITLAKVKD